MTQAATLPDTLEIACSNCGATLVLEPHLRTAECPYCASTSIVERPSSAGRIEPAFALGFAVDRERASHLCARWIGKRRRFARKGFERAVPERGRGLYMPAWLFGAAAHADYTCEIGEDYTETYTTTDSKGRRVTRTRTKTEWRALSGTRSTWMQDVLVTASKGIANEMLERVEPFDLRSLRRYSPALLSGWIAEEASLSASECREVARAECTASLERELARFLPGDSHRGLRIHTRFEEETSELVLLPVWVFAVRNAQDEQTLQILVNGQTGEVGGDVPRSWSKIALVVVAVLAAAFLVFAVVAALVTGTGLFAFLR